MIGTIALLLSAVIGGSVLVYTMKDFLLGFFRKIMVPAVKRIAGAVAEIILTILDLIEGTVTYTAQAIRKVVYSFQEKVLGIVANYQKVSYNEAVVTTETFVMDGTQMRKASTNQLVGKNEIPDDIWETLVQRGKVEMRHEKDLLNELNQKVRL
jgi:hypothetical protein